MKFEKISLGQWINDIGTDVGYEDIKIPKRATSGSAGYDFFAINDIEIPAGTTLKIPTGIKAKIDNGKVLKIYPRSGLGFKYMLQLVNQTGIIDEDYYNNANNEGHIWIKLYNGDVEKRTVTIKKGEAVAQGIIEQYFLVEDDNADGVRNGGFGSTTK